MDLLKGSIILLSSAAVTLVIFSSLPYKLDELLHKRSKKGRIQADHSQRLRIQKIVDQARKELDDAM